MANRELYRITTSLCKGKKIIGYLVENVNTGEQIRYTKEQVILLAARNQIVNCVAHLMRDSVVLRGKGVNLDDLPKLDMYREFTLSSFDTPFVMITQQHSFCAIMKTSRKTDRLELIDLYTFAKEFEKHNFDKDYGLYLLTDKYYMGNDVEIDGRYQNIDGDTRKIFINVSLSGKLKLKDIPRKSLLECFGYLDPEYRKQFTDKSLLLDNIEKYYRECSFSISGRNY